QDVSRVRRAHAARLLLAVERERVGIEALAPELLVEPLAEPRRRVLEPGGAQRLADSAREPGSSKLRLVDVALHLRERDRARRERAVGMRHAVERVLPALVREPAIGLAQVLDEPVAVLVPVLVDPGERALDVRPER